ncbi:MAG TPA: ABC transporter substrate-binding protein [Candidatus Saccharimonadales bacterium]|nr:ABC transporter substrate-binding protein [Candidatus Saccharimonadales bacterium]
MLAKSYIETTRNAARLSMWGYQSKRALSKAVVGVVIIVLVIAAGFSAYYFSSLGSSTSTMSSGTTSAAGSSQAVPQTLTYETLQTIQYLDPHVSYDIFGAGIEQNVYESLLWFKGSDGQSVVPWLAQNYSISTDGKTVTFTLRDGIKFADGETLNSSAVYFSYNRLLIMDGSAPVGHGTQASWIIQQLLNTSLSSNLCGCAQTYGVSYVKSVLAENYVEITGPLTLTLHIMNPNSALGFMLANQWANILAPDYTMQQDIQFWSKSGSGYTLPYPTLSGDFNQQAYQYFVDYQATCNTKGCGATYLDSSPQGSLAGTGPYTFQSVDTSTNIITFQANPNYWGGPDGNIKAQIPTVIVKYVPDQTTREIDLQNAAKSAGQAMVIDVTSTNIYDVADRSSWLNNNQLVSTISGVTIQGPFTQYAAFFIPLDTNVTNPYTGTYYKFQPFADLRLRMAFADAVNLTQINQNYNNKLGEVANEVLPPGIPPVGAYDPSITPAYSYNPVAVQNLLLDAMMHPLTQFTLKNGTSAPSGMFDNTFGCSQLNANNQCDHPTAQSVPLVYATGDTVDEALLNQLAGTVNNVSLTYNMGLTVQVTPLPSGQMTTQAFSGEVYAWAEAPFGWYDDYPWSMDFLGPILSPGGIYTAPGGWNLKDMGNYWSQAQQANIQGDIPTVVKASKDMARLGNSAVMDIWTFYPDIYMVMTSNIQGFYFNPAIYTTGQPQYFASLY